MLAALTCILFESSPRLFQALFESVSGLTTTDASAFADLTNLPKKVLLWRSLTQWLGGMGILAMFKLVSSNIGSGGKNLFCHEFSIHPHEVPGTSMKRAAR